MIDNPMDEAQAGHKQLLDNKVHATAEPLEIDKRRARPQSKSQGSAVIQTDRVVERLGNNTVEQPFRHCLPANGKLFRALRAPLCEPLFFYVCTHLHLQSSTHTHSSRFPCAQTHCEQTHNLSENTRLVEASEQLANNPPKPKAKVRSGLLPGMQVVNCGHRGYYRPLLAITKSESRK